MSKSYTVERKQTWVEQYGAMLVRDIKSLRDNICSEENKYLNTLLFCKFSHLEIMEGSEIVIKNPEITMYDFFNYSFVWYSCK